VLDKKHILIVDDVEDNIQLAMNILKEDGYQFSFATNGEQALSLVQQSPGKFDLILLDIMMPGIDGYEVCKTIKSKSNSGEIPIIFLTAKTDLDALSKGFALGAVDYITKPFSPKELVARVKAVLRRGTLVESVSRQDQVQVGKLAIDPTKYEVTVAGNEIRLTATEFRLLHYLASNSGRVFSREQLLSRAMGDDVVVVDRNIDVHIRGIRKKMNTEPPMIETIRGVGYRLRDPA